VTKSYTYDPDGQTWGSDAPEEDAYPAPEDFGYTDAYRRSGGEQQYHNGLRSYDTRTARWTSTDSLDQPGDLQDANPYQYVGSNPVNGIDPPGQDFNPFASLERVFNNSIIVRGIKSLGKNGPQDALRCYQGVLGGGTIGNTAYTCVLRAGGRLFSITPAGRVVGCLPNVAANR
jgi:RHS repeat-associated protein